MDRRTFNRLTGLISIGALTKVVEASAAPLVKEENMPPDAGRELVLEDDSLLAAFDRRTGALTRLHRKSSSWAIQRRPELGRSFRLLAPMPKRRDNFVLGQKQIAVSAEKVSDRQARFVWKNLISEHGGMLSMTFSATVTLDDGALTFEGDLVNDSDVTVETIDYPYLGDLSAPKPDSSLRAEHMWYDNLVGDEIHPHFFSGEGYWGIRYPRRTIDSKQSLYCLIQAPDQGLYVAMHDATMPYLAQFTFEQHPAVIDSVTNIVPPADSISGLPVHLEFSTCHFVFAQPHSTKALAPIVFRAYSGDWHAGVDVYTKWRKIWFKDPHLPDWVKDVHSWLQLQVNGAEEDYSIRYRDLKSYIDGCAANNVRAIQLVGWNNGGQDRGDPSQNTDPNLGTWQDLRDAIAYAQSKGVKIILFGKLYWADLTTKRYKDELYKYAATDPYGIPYETGGYSYTTTTQLAGINNRRRAIMDVQSQAYRDIATGEFKKILALGAAGWLFDEVCHHGPVEYSFSPDHGYTRPSFIYGGDMPLARQFRDAADMVSPDYIFAGEGPQDWLMQYYPVSYFRIGDGSRPVARYIDSYAPLVVAVTGIDDREKLNLILMNRYVISYEPYNFKGRVTDFPLTLAYGKKIDALRRKYKQWIWDADFRDTLGATVTGDGPVRYGVFSKETDRRAVVVINPHSRKPLTATVKLPNPRPLVVATPEQQEAQPTSGIVHIPARSAAVVMEQ
jgi:hypothetical protein